MAPGFFVSLIWKESRFRIDAISPAGARGIAQFMPATANDRGLQDPFEPIESVKHAASYLRDLRHEFGNWGLAAAAYNGGPSRVRRWISEGSSLPRETRDYVFSLTGNQPEWFLAEGREVDAQRGDGAEDFSASCLKIAGGAKPKLVASRQERARPTLPWGVEIARHFRGDVAELLARQLQKRYPRVLGGRATEIVKQPRNGPGPRYINIAQVAFSSKNSADHFCVKLKRSGARCAVIRNY
nr:lytic transglycosylase domain-containing protein [Jiella avicenniae]